MLALNGAEGRRKVQGSRCSRPQSPKDVLVRLTRHLGKVCSLFHLGFPGRLRGTGVGVGGPLSELFASSMSRDLFALQDPIRCVPYCFSRWRRVRGADQRASELATREERRMRCQSRFCPGASGVCVSVRAGSQPQLLLSNGKARWTGLAGWRCFFCVQAPADVSENGMCAS